MTKKRATTAPMDAAFAFLSSRARTAREVEEHLDALNYGEYEVYAAVERLKELGYLDDEKFARDFIDSRLRTKPVSRRKLRDQLIAHKLERHVIDEALLVIDDAAERNHALLVAKKYLGQFTSLPEAERARRVASRLATRGYDYDLIGEIVGGDGPIDYDPDEPEAEEEGDDAWA